MDLIVYVLIVLVALALALLLCQRLGAALKLDTQAVQLIEAVLIIVALIAVLARGGLVHR